MAKRAQAGKSITTSGPAAPKARKVSDLLDTRVVYCGAGVEPVGVGVTKQALLTVVRFSGDHFSPSAHNDRLTDELELHAIACKSSD